MALKWRKSWIDENLDGSIRKDLNPAERSVWADLLDLCGKSRRWGVIERSQGIPWTARELAERFVTSEDVVSSTITKCLIEGRLALDNSGALVVTNWGKYQANSRKPTDRIDIPLSPQDREAQQQASAARLAYLQPEAAQRGISHRAIEQEAKTHNTELLQQ